MPGCSLFTAHCGNPILTRDNWPYRINSVFNPAACGWPTETRSFFAGSRTRTACRICVRPLRQRHRWNGGSIPSNHAPKPHEFPEEIWGIEDPRITYVPELEQYAVAYTSFARGGPGVSLALTKDFRSFERFGVIMSPEDKDAALLPRRIGGRWAADSPAHDRSRRSYVDILLAGLAPLGNHKVILEARRGGWWDANKIGLCSPPIETEKAG